MCTHTIDKSFKNYINNNATTTGLFNKSNRNKYFVILYSNQLKVHNNIAARMK